MGGITAPVLGSGACPAWMALVPRPQSGEPAAAAPLSLFIKPVDSADATANSTIVPAFARRPHGARWALAERAGAGASAGRPGSSGRGTGPHLFPRSDPDQFPGPGHLAVNTDPPGLRSSPQGHPH